jgi:transcriptional regulator with XRE-family HTH domain
MTASNVLVMPERTRGLTASTADLGHVVRQLRKERGATIEALALDAGIHPTYLSGIERGVRNPTWEKLCELAHALAVPLSTIAHKAEIEAAATQAACEARAQMAASR